MVMYLQGASVAARGLGPCCPNVQELAVKLLEIHVMWLWQKRNSERKRRIDKLHLSGVVGRTQPEGIYESHAIGSILGGVNEQDEGVTGVEARKCILQGVDGEKLSSVNPAYGTAKIPGTEEAKFRAYLVAR